MKTKGTRVWVAVDEQAGPLLMTARFTRREAYRDLDNDGLFQGWREDGITIRRATLVLDPLPKRKRKGAA